MKLNSLSSKFILTSVLIILNSSASYCLDEGEEFLTNKSSPQTQTPPTYTTARQYLNKFTSGNPLLVRNRYLQRTFRSFSSKRSSYAKILLGGVGVLTTGVVLEKNFRRKNKPIIYTTHPKNLHTQSSQYYPNFLPYFYTENPKISSKSMEEILDDKIKKVEKRLANQKVASHITVFIGKAGAGKSCIYNYEQGIPLIAKLQDKTLIIERKDEEKIGNRKNGAIIHGSTPGTSYPSLSKGGDYFDCPGFDDPRGEEQDIVNAYSLHKLFDTKGVQNFRIALVVSKEEMTVERGKPFVELIRQLGELFPNGQNEIKKGLNLIITKGSREENDVNIIKNKISGIRDAHRGMTDFQKEILTFLASKENDQITFFEKPTAPGDIPHGPKLVKGSFYIARDKVTPSISVSPETKLYIKKLADRVTTETAGFLVSVYEKLDHYTTKLIKLHSGPASKVRESFKILNYDLKTIGNNDSNSSEGDAKNIEKMLQDFDSNLPIAFSALTKRHQFLRRIRPEDTAITLDLNKDGILTKISTHLQPLAEECESFSGDKGGIFRGQIVGTSDIPKSLNASTVTIYALKSLIIDDDLIIPGGNVAFASPYWNIKGAKIINLQGESGEPIKPFKELKGEDGKPGTPGRNGGNFYGIVDNLEGGENLIINVSGGRGGDGQNGGDGIDGKNGEDGIIEDVKERKVTAVKYNKPVERSGVGKVLRWPFTANNESRLIYRSGEQGKNGGKAGAGGRGGYGGKKGSIALENSKFEKVLHKHKLSIVDKDGERGNDGVHGKPGKGGIHGKVFEGIYIEKSMSGWGYAGRAVADGIAGAVTGAGAGALGGPFGIAVGAIGGGVVGVLTPLVGSGIDNCGWEKEPYMLDYVEFAEEGEPAKKVNSNGLSFPSEGKPFSESELREIRHNFWQHFINNVSQKN